MKVALYARVSTKEQTTDHQIRLLREWAEKEGRLIHREYRDVFTGKASNRPAFDEMLRDMRAGLFGAIAVTKLDRIGRSLQHLLGLFQEFANKGIHFIATTQSIDTTSASGRLQMQIIGAFAEWEASIISERTKEALKGNPNVGKRGPDKKPRKKRGGRRKPLPLNNQGGF